MTVTLVTGANRGIGRETARQLVEKGHTVYAGARDAERGRAAAAEIGARFVQIDVTDDDSVEAALRSVGDAEGHLDVLVNNAGAGTGAIGADGLTAAAVLGSFDTNAVSVVRTTQAALPLLRRSQHPVIVNLSSALGSFAAVTDPGSAQFAYNEIAYCASKAAVSMLTVQYAKALPDVKVNAVEPGVTATDLTGGHGQSPAQGAAVVVAAAMIGPDGPTGTFRDRDGTQPW